MNCPKKNESKNMATAHKSVKSVEMSVDSFGNHQVNGVYLPVKRFTWKNQNRIQIQLINYGATITSIKFPNRKGIVDDVILGYDDMKGYLENMEYYYGMIGRCANFIKRAYYINNRNEIKLSENMCGHHYNGGSVGFDKVLWEYYISGSKVILSHFSADGTEGYPGDLLISATYELTPNNEFRIDIKAYTTKTTICNITNSVYFNLAGHNTGVDEINKHDITLNADCKIVTNNECIPTGEVKAVYNTIYDFQIPVKIGQVMEKLDGFNTHFCVNRGVEQGNCFAVRLYHSESGRIVEIYTNQYGLQLETANNYPIRQDSEKVQKKVTPYLKTTIATFDLIDEIHNKVADLMNADKSNDYSDFLRFLKDIQKKEIGSLHRTSSNTSNIPCNQKALIKRSRISSLSSATLTSKQLKYVDKIICKIDSLPETEHLAEIRDTLDRAYNRSKSENCSIKSLDSKNDEVYYKDIRGKKGAKYSKHCGISLQPQNYPDAVNNANFPSVLLKPGGVYHNTITYKFFIKSNNVGLTGYIG